MMAAVCQAIVGLNIIDGYANSFLQVLGFCIFIHCLKEYKGNLYLVTWIFASSWLSISVWWLYIAMHDIGGMPWFMSVAAILLLCSCLAIYYAIALSFFVKTYNYLPAILRFFMLAACWTVAELARAQWFTGFPWSAIGYSHVNGMLSYAAPWVGVYGVGFLSAFIAAWLSELVQQENKNYKTKAQIIIIMLIISVPAIRNENTKGSDLSVNLLQANISQLIKFNSGRQEALQWYADQASMSKAEITIMPEIALPYFKNELPIGYWEKLTDKFTRGQQAALIGMPTIDKDKGFGNSAIGLGFGVEQQYDKHHLVPFGEFTPKLFQWFTRLMVNDMGEFNRGSISQEPFIWKDHKLSITICYEDLFGEDLAVRFIEKDKVPSVLVNISNIAWFGESMVVNQHLDIARMRSLEFDRPTVRATNTGATAVISSEGIVIKQLPPFTRGNLTAVIKTREEAITPYAYWAGHWGLAPLWSFCLLIMTIAVAFKYSAKFKSRRL